MIKQQSARLNAYVCPDKHRTVTIDIDEGVTPFMMGCKFPGCGKMAHSLFYKVPQDITPEYEWYKPTAEQVEAIIQQQTTKIPKYADHYDERVISVRQTFEFHFKNGGLDLRKITANDTTTNGDKPNTD